MHEARKALDKSQLLLDTAIDAAEKASAEAKAAADQVKILEAEHGHLVLSLLFQTCLGPFGQNYTPVDPKQLFHIHVVILAPDVGNFACQLRKAWITSNTFSGIIAI